MSIDWGMMKNDVWGDCCVAMVGHAVMALTGEQRPPDDLIGAAYQRWCEGPPYGCNPAVVMRRWLLEGLSGVRPWGYCRIRDREQIIRLSELGGVTCVSVVDFEGTRGQHCVPIIRATNTEVTYVSWGQVYVHDWAYHEAHMLQQWAAFHRPSWLLPWWFLKNYL
jgi:hypothetical protein